MPESVTTPNLRFKWVKGWLTGGIDPADGSVECGDGTAYPLEVTVAQMEEIFYRVRDAKWVSGSAAFRQSATAAYYESSVTFTATAPASKLAATVSSDFNYVGHSFRGYLTMNRVESIGDDPPMVYVADGNLGPAYEIGENYNTPNFYENGKMKIREAAKEPAMWLGYPEGVESGIGQMEIEQPFELGADDVFAYNQYAAPNQFRTGFSVHAATFIDASSSPPIYAPFQTFFDSAAGGSPVNYYGAGCSLGFSGYVAWIDTDGSGNPLSPGNSIYIGLGFVVQSRGTIPTSFSTHEINTLRPTVGTVVDTGKKLILRLSGVNNEVTAKLYGATETYGDPPETGYHSSTDWIYEATEWWPYQDQNGNVWNPATGLPL